MMALLGFPGTGRRSTSFRRVLAAMEREISGIRPEKKETARKETARIVALNQKVQDVSPGVGSRRSGNQSGHRPCLGSLPTPLVKGDLVDDAGRTRCRPHPAAAGPRSDPDGDAGWRGG